MRRFGARVLPVSSVQTLNNTKLLGGPLVICGWSLNDGVIGQSLTTDASVAAPAAGGTVASIALGFGAYQVTWEFELTGTPGAGDIDNVGLYIGGNLVQQSVNLGVVGNYGPFTTVVDSLFGANTLAAKAIGAATAGTTYRVNITAVPQIETTCSILDGATVVASVAIAPGGVDSRWLSDRGIQIDTEVHVQVIQGAAQGVLWYYLAGDYVHTERHKHEQE